MSDLPKLTPMHQMKPKLEWVGRILGMDLYVDTHGERQPGEKRDLAQHILQRAFCPPTKKEEENDKNR